MVFGPADLCFNAVSILLDIPNKIQDFNAAVDGLFDEVSVMLSQFRIYQRIEQFSTIDPDLYQTIHKLMICFVNICALSINLRDAGKWKRFKSSAKKVLFDNDSGVSGAIEEFRSLIKTQGVIRETITLEHVLKSEKTLAQLLLAASDSGKKLTDIATGVDVLTAAENDRKLENIKAKQIEKIQKTLMGSTDTAQKLTRASKTTCNEHWQASVQSSGSWRRELDEYKNWVDVKSNASPLLLITGENNSGKTFLVSSIVHELQSVHAHGASEFTRTPVVAYHFFNKRAEKSSQDLRPAETALKCLALQIAEQDDVYAKSTAAFCDTIKEDARFKDSSCTELWDALRFTAPKRNVTYFLLLDGLDQLSEDNAEQLLSILGSLERTISESDRCQIRLLASGMAETFKSEVFQDVPSINIEQYNNAEIRLYIDRELKIRDLLQDSDSEIQRLRKRVDDKLAPLGNFFKVSTALEKIGTLIASDGSPTE
jgi:Cdc6-like AAA superfamily ATPase